MKSQFLWLHKLSLNEGITWLLAVIALAGFAFGVAWQTGLWVGWIEYDAR